MALLDRFRAQLRPKHPDAAVRLAYVAELSLNERDLIVAMAREDDDPRVRRAAVAKLTDPAALAAVTRDDADESVRGEAVAMLRDIALDSFEDVSRADGLAAVNALGDTKVLAQIARTALREEIGRQALARVTDAHALGSIARHAALESIRRTALDRLQDHGEIVGVAMNSEFKDTAVSAVERLETREELEQVAAGGKKSAAKRARSLLREMDERAAQTAVAASSPVPDPADIAHVERAPSAPIPVSLPSIDESRAAEIALKEAEAARRRDERQAAERARGEAARDQAREQARKEAEKEAKRRCIRLGELVEAAEGAAADADLAAARRAIAVARLEWKDLATGAAIDPEMAARFAGAETRLTKRETDAQETDARARRDALNRVHQLLGRVEPLLARTDLSLKGAERALRDVRAAIAEGSPLPSKRDHDEATSRLKAVLAALVPKVQELRELAGWQRWANVGIQEQLCEKMEALSAVEEADELSRHLRELQQQWRLAADVPRGGQGEALWRRFKAAYDTVWARCEAHFAAEAQARAENGAKKTALVERAEALATSMNWISTADEIKRLQLEWKTIGPVTRGQEKALWERFRSACDRFFTRRQEDLTKRKAMWAENLARKEALCARAEALGESTDWDAAAAEIKRLQAEWKTVGPVKKSRSEAVWQRFRTACDQFFARYSKRHDIARAERVAAREALCTELEALAPPVQDADGSQGTSTAELRPDGESQAPPVDLVQHVRTLRARWQQELAARGVDRARALALNQRFGAAFDRVLARWPAVFGGTDLDPEANRQRMEALVRRMEDLVISLAGAAPADVALSPTTKLAAMLKEALAANTIGGKVDEGIRWRAAQEDTRQAQAAWSRIGLVADPVRRSLTDRFERACRRIMDGPSGFGDADRSRGAGMAERRAGHVEPPPARRRT